MAHGNGSAFRTPFATPFPFRSHTLLRNNLICGRLLVVLEPSARCSQDYGYWYTNFLTSDLASCMIALDRSTKANGCLQVLKGSHIKRSEFHTAQLVSVRLVLTQRELLCSRSKGAWRWYTARWSQGAFSFSTATCSTARPRTVLLTHAGR